MKPCRQSPCANTVGRCSPAGAWCLVLSLAAACAGQPSAPAVPRDTLRLGFSNSMFVGVNENDAKASIKALATAVVRERHLPADPDPLLLADTTAVAAAVRAGEADALGITTEEYWVLCREVRFDRFVMAVNGGDPTEQYVLVVRRADGVTTLAALRGKRLNVIVNPRTCLARVWLEVELARAGLPPLPEHFGSVTDQSKLAKAVLEVFFRKTDACLVSRRGFATMTELNPQVGAQLTVLAASPKLVPALFAFRADFSPALKERSVHEMSLIHTSTAGQQAMTIFQVGQVAERPAADLASALALLDEYARLRPAASAARVAVLRHRQNPDSTFSRP